MSAGNKRLLPYVLLYRLFVRFFVISLNHYTMHLGISVSCNRFAANFNAYDAGTSMVHIGVPVAWFFSFGDKSH
jgi:hypothetical protein